MVAILNNSNTNKVDMAFTLEDMREALVAYAIGQGIAVSMPDFEEIGDDAFMRDPSNGLHGIAPHHETNPGDLIWTLTIVNTEPV